MTPRVLEKNFCVILHSIYHGNGLVFCIDLKKILNWTSPMLPTPCIIITYRPARFFGKNDPGYFNIAILDVVAKDETQSGCHKPCCLGCQWQRTQRRRWPPLPDGQTTSQLPCPPETVLDRPTRSTEVVIYPQRWSHRPAGESVLPTWCQWYVSAAEMWD